MIGSGTGSRQLFLRPIAYQQNVKTYLIDEFERLGITEVISGMAEGFDAVLALAAIRADIPLTAALPSSDYREYYWRRNSVTGRDNTKIFDWLLSRATTVVEVCDHHLLGRANKIRNAWMAERGEFFFCWAPEWRSDGLPTSPGTRHCMGLLQDRGTPHTVLNHRVFEEVVALPSALPR